MITPFYYKSKLAFHLGLKERENGSFDILTNIPKQILDANYWAISKLGLEQSLIERSKEQYLNAVAEIILRDRYSEFFFYYKYISQELALLQEVFGEIITFNSGFVLLPERYYSDKKEPTRYYILCQKYFACKIFTPKIFDKFMFKCSREDFEKVIFSESIRQEYVEHYAVNNEFFVAEEDEHIRLYFLVSNGVPKIIIIHQI